MRTTLLSSSIENRDTERGCCAAEDAAEDGRAM
jgi:hypothetical protein